MPRNPPPLLTELRRASRELGLVQRRVLLAVSGGVDSMVLLDALDRLRGELDLELAIAHVHHGLRGADADADAALVAREAKRRGLAFLLERIEPGALREAGPSRTRPTLQEAARRLRREALWRAAGSCGASLVATAHQRDDQAETLLLRLFRGTGPAGLTGIPERSADGRIVRPLLRVPRAEIEAWACAERLRWREDASNASPCYARSRLRLRLRELAQELSPGWDRALADLSETLRREREWIDPWVEETAAGWLRREGEALRLRAEGWDEIPVALARRLLHLAWSRVGGQRDVSRAHLERARSFLARARPGERIQWPGGVELWRDAHGFLLLRVPRERREGVGVPTEGGRSAQNRPAGRFSGAAPDRPK